MNNTVEAAIHYVQKGPEKARYHANDSSRDTVIIAPQMMSIFSARDHAVSIEDDGFELITAPSEIADLLAIHSYQEQYATEMREAILRHVGADDVVITSPGILRFSEAREECGDFDNSRPARFAHIDISDATAAIFAERSAPRPGWKRCVAYNLWRAISPAPQDVPLALCSATSTQGDDLIPATAVFDVKGAPEWTFEGLTFAYHPKHRWYWYPDMHRDEAILFVTNDSQRGQINAVPHVAFDNPQCTGVPGLVPRASIELRANAYWY